ncbi:alpha/beta fold hydrolase [Actinoplanes sp. N902-109]|uniref:alpha/beta fold hydrolase n=1 Tax=Actinoplanes sp. (strain N902-109) TaxID=649831 RepID=UPI0003293940|nr:alpha/beta hydrolase [Actinoplanes sp. N902-109]AGL16514.1 alpha/beta hydrolase fold protein [Actinoplanes sp. N902-109]
MTTSADPGSGAAPAWFTDALAAPVTEHEVTVAGTAIAYRAWGAPAGQGVVLVHGAAAHSRWWDHVAPLLLDSGRVVALDLSGHGDSGRRDAYSLDLWMREVLAVIADAGLGGSAVVIGHSLGGAVTLRLAASAGARIAGVVLLDSPLAVPGVEQRASRERRAFGAPPRVYPSRAAIVRHFSPMPKQPVLGYVAEHVAATSVREVSGGWGWKWDPAVFARERVENTLTTVDCRVALVNAEHGVVSADRRDAMAERLGPATEIVEIAGAQHHIMLDQPLALVAALRKLLAGWG